MKATIVNNTVTLVSEFTTAQLQKLAQYKPNALLKKEEKNVVFALGVGNNASINKNGICFNETTDSGKAALTIQICGCETKEEKEKFVAETFGYAILEANSMNEQITAALAEVDTDFSAMIANITSVEL